MSNQLTPHQQDVNQQSQTILLDSKRLVIKGSAGVGKTFMVNELIKALSLRHKGTILCSAPTNKAVAVIKDKVDNTLGNINFITVHSALKLSRKIDNKTGDVTYEPTKSKQLPLERVGLMIIDEASMLSTELLIYLEKYAVINNTTLIFIGDDKQLNPVGESYSPVFMGKPTVCDEDEAIVKIHSANGENFYKFVPYPQVELTEIVRQGKNNPIIHLSRNISDIKLNQANFSKETGGYLYVHDTDRIIEKLAEVNGSDELKYLAFTNQEVDRINKLVRHKIYGNPAKIEKGESLIFDEPYKDEYVTNEEVTVRDVLVRTKVFKYVVDMHGTVNSPGDICHDPMYGFVELKYYSINPLVSKADGVFVMQDSILDNIIVIHEDSEKELASIKTLLKRLAINKSINWKDHFYAFFEQFANMKYNHAITVHKSQGSTFKDVVLNVKNLNLCKDASDRNKLIYTAVTRASNILILYNT